MKISELITKLEQVKRDEGDLQVVGWDCYHDCTGYKERIELDTWDGRQVLSLEWKAEGYE